MPVSPFRSDGKRTKHTVKRVCGLQCDVCFKSWEIRFNIRYRCQELNFCSKFCTDIARTKDGIVRAKVEATCLERLGANSPFEAESSKLLARSTMLDKYGVDNPSKSVIFQQKKIKTSQLNFGVDHPSRAEHIRQKTKRTLLARYGVDNPMRLPSIQRQSRLTAMKNGTKSWSSCIEEKFALALHTIFGEHDVHRQCNIKSWAIDFYIVSIDTYIQFDGVYWHGHMHSIKAMQTASTPQLRSIYQTWLSDREQDKWFVENNLKLVRITDQEFKSTLFDLQRALR